MEKKTYSLATVLVSCGLSFLAGAATGATTVIMTMPPEGYGFMADDKKAATTAAK